VEGCTSVPKKSAARAGRSAQLQRLAQTGFFAAMLPGNRKFVVRLGNKSKGNRSAARAWKKGSSGVSEAVNLILRYIPYVQPTSSWPRKRTQGGRGPFEAGTKGFVDVLPGAFPGYSLADGFGAGSAAQTSSTSVRPGGLPFRFFSTPEQQPWQ